MKKNMIKKNCYSTIFDSVFGLDWAASYVPSTDMDTFLVSADTAVLILEGLSGLASSILISSRLSVPAPLPQMPASLLLTVNLIIHYREIKHIVIKLPLLELPSFCGEKTVNSLIGLTVSHQKILMEICSAKR